VKFKIDENLPIEAATTPRDASFDAETIRDERLSGADDHVVAARVQREGRILVTLDLDFSNIRAYPPEQFAGIMVLRLKAQDKATVLAYTYMRRAVTVLQQRSPVGELWIIQHDRVRFRQGN
jgi:predicted nuclease of predicted toxin-antitoxin system